MPDFIVSPTTGTSTQAPGQVVTLFASGATSGATFTAGSAPAATASSAGYVGYNATKTYIFTNTGANAFNAGAVQMQGSDDGTNWYNTGSAPTITTLGAGVTTTVATDVQGWKYIRCIVTTAITVASGNGALVVSIAL